MVIVKSSIFPHASSVLEFQATFFPHQIFILPVIGCTHKKHKANWNPFIIDILKNITSLASNDVTESENLA